MTTAMQTIPNATVQASAGSGKTYLLISRIIQLLLAGTKPGSILAITFTRKAAAEMQQRLMQRLLLLSKSHDNELAMQLSGLGITPSAENQLRARSLYEQLLRTEQPVKTTTFHAFCQDLLRRFPLEANVPAGFELVEQTADLYDAAWEALMNEAAQEDTAALAASLDRLFKQQSLFNTRSALFSFLQQRSDWWSYTLAQDDAVDYASTRLARQLQIQTGQDPLPRFLQDESNQQALKRVLHYLLKRANKTSQQQADDLDQALAQTASAQQCYRLIRNVFLTKQGEPRSVPRTKAMDKALGESGSDEFIATHAHCCERIKATDEALAAQHTYTMTSAWYRAGAALLQHYQRIKQEQRLLDFTDLEWQSYLLLTQHDNATWVQYKLDNRIDHLLIDEFQDTNPTQWQLILPLLHEFETGRDDRMRSVFLVGDAKQSIYRFRRAEPQLFTTASHWLTNRLQAETIPLNKSWRSSPAVIDFVNTLFGEGPLHAQLSDFHTHQTVHEQLWGKVTLLPLKGEQDAGDDDSETIWRNPLLAPKTRYKHAVQDSEGKYIATIIRDLIENRTILGQANGARPARYSDVLILLRSRTHVGEFEQALRQAGIPYLGAERGTLLDALEVIDLVNLLQWLITPYDNHALAGILRSPLFSVGDDELLRLANHGTGNWQARLAALAEELPPHAPLVRAQRLLQQWQARAGHIPVHDLLDQIFSEGNVLARFNAAFPASLRPRVSSNLTRLLELALEMDSGRYPSLTRFISWLKILRQQSTDAPNEPPGIGQQDRVRLLTIHEAKGLEAPIVFIVDSARPLAKRTAHAALVDWPADEDQPASFLLTGRKEELDRFTLDQLGKQQAKAQIEETNLLYVAVTRAQQLLYISGTRPQRGKNLGWYGEIGQRYTLEPLSLEHAQVLHETNAAPVYSATDETMGDKVAGNIDPRLSQPLQIGFTEREIAPSMMRGSPGELSDYKGDEDGRVRGIAIHRLLENLLARPDDADGALIKTAQSLALEQMDAQLIAWWHEARSLLQKEELQYLFNPQHYAQAYNEIPIHYQYHGRTVHGIIDRLVLTGDTVYIIDYKTHEQVDSETIAMLAQHYQQQMKWYIEGVKRLWPDYTPQAQLLFTATATICPITL